MSVEFKSSSNLRREVLSGGITGSPWNLIPVVLVPILVGVGISNLPESGNEPIDLDILAVPVAVALMFFMGAWALQTVRSARMNPENY